MDSIVFEKVFQNIKTRKSAHVAYHRCLQSLDMNRIVIGNDVTCMELGETIVHSTPIEMISRIVIPDRH